jgi:hypothetical protein
MSSSAWVDPRIRSVRVAGVRSYLQKRGWHLQPGPETNLFVFEGPLDDDGEPIIEVLPVSEQMRDFLQRVVELITALSVIEDRPAPEVLSDILAADNATPAGTDAEKNGGNAIRKQDPAGAKREIE